MIKEQKKYIFDIYFIEGFTIIMSFFALILLCILIKYCITCCKNRWYKIKNKEIVEQITDDNIAIANAAI